MARDEPGFLTALASWGGGILGGAAIGAALNRLLAPGSDWALAIGIFALPLIFVIGMKMWYAALAGLVFNRLAGAFWSALWRRTGFREEAQARFADLRGGPIPGTGCFLLVALAIGPLAGLLTALGPVTSGAVAILAAWTGLAFVYGAVLRWLARSGRLPPPDTA